jgi:hypothetical protein
MPATLMISTPTLTLPHEGGGQLWAMWSPSPLMGMGWVPDGEIIVGWCHTAEGKPRGHCIIFRSGGGPGAAPGHPSMVLWGGWAGEQAGGSGTRMR